MLRRAIGISAALLSAACGVAYAAGHNSTEIVVGADSGRIESLRLDGKAIPLRHGQGGFTAYDATKKAAIRFSAGSVRGAEGKTVFDCEASGLRLHAEFTARNGSVLVAADLENLSEGDRGVILDYCLPAETEGAVFASDMEEPVPINESTRAEANAFPVAALCAEAFGVAMAIPPSEPRIFGMTGGAQRLTVKFYLGLSPDTAKFPNRATSAFVIYSVEPAWGFRSALEEYYSLHPDYCMPRIKADGFWLKKIPREVPSNVKQYGIKKVNTRRLTDDSFAPYKRHGILTVPKS